MAESLLDRHGEVQVDEIGVELGEILKQEDGNVDSDEPIANGRNSAEPRGALRFATVVFAVVDAHVGPAPREADQAGQPW